MRNEILVTFWRSNPSRRTAHTALFLPRILHLDVGIVRHELPSTMIIAQLLRRYDVRIILIELLTGQKAISKEKIDKDRSLATRFLTCMEENCLERILDPQIWEDGRKEEVVSVARLAQRCLNLKGKMRPTMKEVAIELESFRMSQDVKEEFEEVIFDGKGMMVSDSEYTWTSSCKSDPRSSSLSRPLMFTTECTSLFP